MLMPLHMNVCVCVCIIMCVCARVDVCCMCPLGMNDIDIYRKNIAFITIIDSTVS